MSDNGPVEVTDSDFEEKVLACKDISVVDFWAPWCGPCHTMAPALEEFAKANADKLKVFKLDVDDNPKTAERYEIRSIPTIIFFRDGEPVIREAKTMSRSTLQENLNSLLESKPD